MGEDSQVGGDWVFVTLHTSLNLIAWLLKRCQATTDSTQHCSHRYGGCGDRALQNMEVRSSGTEGTGAEIGHALSAGCSLGPFGPLTDARVGQDWSIEGTIR